MGFLDRVQSCPLNMQYHLHLEKHLFLLVLVWVQNVNSSPSYEDFYLIVELGGNDSQGHREVVRGTGQNFPSTGPYVIIVKQEMQCFTIYCTLLILSSTDTARIYIYWLSNLVSRKFKGLCRFGGGGVPLIWGPINLGSQAKMPPLSGTRDSQQPA
jgi:hypothetical protein